MTVDEKVNRKLEQAYVHIKPYMEDQTELYEMCKNCECWKGKQLHDYDECRNKPCFRFWLGFTYLHWDTAWE